MLLCGAEDYDIIKRIAECLQRDCIEFYFREVSYGKR